MANPETKTIILITGANSGIGLATSKVLALASPSYHVIMACRSASKAASALSEILTLQPLGTLSTLSLDVLSPTSIAAAAAQVAGEFGHVDVLLNNAAVGGLSHSVNATAKTNTSTGTGTDTSAGNANNANVGNVDTDVDLDDFHHRFSTVLATNVTGPALVAEAFRPLLLKSTNPYAIYVGSGQRTLMRNAAQAVQGQDHLRARGAAGLVAYQVSKAALNMLGVLEWREHGGTDMGRGKIKVFVLSPGFVRSNLRGEDEEARSGWGMAGDPMVAGKVVLGVVRGERDADVGCLIHRDGVYPW